MKRIAIFLVLAAVTTNAALAAEEPELDWPPRLPGGKHVDSGSSPLLLKPTDTLRKGVTIAATPPTIDFMYYDAQTYHVKSTLWSVWGDGLAVGEKYYSAIGDHMAPHGNAFVYEYDSTTQRLVRVVDLQQLLKLPQSHYTPGKIHSRLDLGSDGWLYFSTHRGSTKVGLAENRRHNHFKGGYIIRFNPEQKKTEIVAHAPLQWQCIPASVLDGDRLIFYGGTADGLGEDPAKFLAYDVRKRKLLYSDDQGPSRYMIFARSTGKLYFHPGTSSPSRTEGPGQLVRFDPEKPGRPVPIAARCGLRSATMETPQGIVYTIDHDELWAFDTKTEKAKSLGPSAVASKTYTTSIDADPKTGRFLYYVPGAHGGAEKDGTPLVQYDVKRRRRKVVAFLHPYLYEKYGYVTLGTFGSAVSPEGDKVYITFNGNRGTTRDQLDGRIRFNTCAMVVVHVPESER